MTRYADPFVCPDCSARLPIHVASCASCGLLLGGPLASELLQTLQTADRLLDRLRAESRDATVPPAAAYPVSPPRPPAPPPAPRSDGRRGISALSVPRILLGLGALCLLVAAVIFLAVAWSWLGVGGRTAVLVGLTLVSGGLGVWLGRRELRVAAEALTTVALGLLALDVVGADDAGWLGDLSAAGLVGVVGGTVLVAALALAFPTRLGAPQIVAVIALSTLGLGVLGATGWIAATAAVVVLAHAALVAAGGFRRLRLMPVAAAVGAACWWLALVVTGLSDATADPSLHALWADGQGVALLVAALILLVPVPFVRAQTVVSRALAAAAAALLTVTVCLPAADESGTVLGTVALAALAAWTAASVVTPLNWRAVPWVSMLLAACPVLGTAAVLTAQAAANAVGSSEPFSRGAGFRLDEPDAAATPVLLVLSVAGLLAAALSFVPRRLQDPWPAVSATAVGLGAIGSLALAAVPAWTVAGALSLLGVLLVASALRRTDGLGAGRALTGATVATLAVPVALPSDVLTTVAAAVLVVVAAVVTVRGRFPDAATGGGMLLPVTAAGFLWCALAVAGVSTEHRAVPVLVVVGLLAITLPRDEIEVSAGLAAVTASAAAVAAADRTSVALAVHLTVAGVLVTASALGHPTRRELGWLGGLLLAAATWVRLADLGVEAPEPYTLPSAVALVLLGLNRLRNDPEAATGRALTPGLLLAVVPSLLWVLVEPISLRATLLGAGCLALVLAGSVLRWNAPLLVGALAGALLVVRELAPYALETPQWVLIGVAGTLLTVVGITWESRLRDLRQAATFLERLR